MDANKCKEAAAPMFDIFHWDKDGCWLMIIKMKTTERASLPPLARVVCDDDGWRL